MKENSEALAQQAKSAGTQSDSEPTIELVTSRVERTGARPCNPNCIPNCQPACVPSSLPRECMPDLIRRCIPELAPPPKPPPH